MMHLHLTQQLQQKSLWRYWQNYDTSWTATNMWSQLHQCCLVLADAALQDAETCVQHTDAQWARRSFRVAVFTLHPPNPLLPIPLQCKQCLVYPKEIVMGGEGLKPLRLPNTAHLHLYQWKKISLPILCLVVCSALPQGVSLNVSCNSLLQEKDIFHPRI